MPGAALAHGDQPDGGSVTHCCDEQLVFLRDCQFLDFEDAKLLLPLDDPSSSNDSESGSWRQPTQPHAILCCDKGVPCMADELELQAEEIEEQYPWRDDCEEVALSASVSSLDDCALSGHALPALPTSLQPAWAAAADSVRAAATGGVMRKTAPSAFSSPDDGWGDSIPVCRSPVLGSRLRAQAHEPRQASAGVSAWTASARQWLRPLHPGGWRGCQKGPRCDRENRHRGICNTRAAPAAFVQQALSSMEAHMDDGGEAAALMPGSPITQRGGLYQPEAFPQGPLPCGGGDGAMDFVEPSSMQPAAAMAAQEATAVKAVLVAPMRMSQRRLKMVPQLQQADGGDSASHESCGASSRRLSGRRRSSSEMLDSGSESSDSEDELQSRGAEFTVQQAAPESRMHRLHGFGGGRAAAPSPYGGDLVDLVPPAKLPRSASASSVSPIPVATGGGGKLGRRAASARAAAVAASRPRKRAGGGRGTGPLAVTQPGQHCSSCHTQVTPVWRAGPLGPKTLCNACGVRYMKTVKPRR